MYHALLPQPAVKDLKTEYRIRFFIVFLFFVSLTILISSVFLFPSYLISSIAEKTTGAQAQIAESNIGTDTSVIAANLTSAQSLVTSISSSALPPLSSVVLRISSMKPRGVSITSFRVEYAGTASSSVSIEGTAATRNDLVAFRQILEGDKSFTDVQVPISDLAPSSNIQFSMQMSVALPSLPKQP